MTDPVPRLVAHRGTAQPDRENTLPAVLAALDQGAEAVEIDVRTTRDGVAVVLHDATLERLWGDPRAVADLDAAEVAVLGDGDVRIPTVAELLALLDGRGATLVVDAVDARDSRAAAIASREAAADVRMVWCGHPDAVAAVRDELHDAETWLAWESLSPPDADDLTTLAPSTLNLDVAFLTPALVEGAHRLGLAVSCWTIDDAALARWAADQGVDSITTNDVSGVRAALARPDDPATADPARVADRSLDLIREIAREVIAYTRSHPVSEITTKAHDADLVTDVDREVERAVRGRVRAAFPSHGFSGEEFGEAPGDAYTWYLDPVDGTTNLAAGIPWTSMSLCLALEGAPLSCAVADPWRDEVLSAGRGAGAWLSVGGTGPAPLRMRTGARLAGGVVGTELDGHRPWSGFAEFLDALAAESCTLRIMGSGTLTLAQVAAGRGVGACVSAFSPIDHGAAVLLAHEAGGVVMTPDGAVTGFPPVGTPMLVAHPDVAQQLHELWAGALVAGTSAADVEQTRYV